MSGSTATKKAKVPAAKTPKDVKDHIAKTAKTAKPATKQKYVSRFDAFDDQGTLAKKTTQERPRRGIKKGKK